MHNRNVFNNLKNNLLKNNLIKNNLIKRNNRRKIITDVK